MEGEMDHQFISLDRQENRFPLSSKANISMIKPGAPVGYIELPRRRTATRLVRSEA
jgi:hypothetical protein